MKILIGATIHICKDYAMERWLQNVAELQQQTPSDLFLVDNSPGTEYVEKVKSYCVKYEIKNYKIVHIELPPEQGKFERVGRSREIIRQYILSHDYDAWFSWDCDQIIPTDALDKMVKMMQADGFMIINPNKWTREVPDLPNADFGVCLIARECLEKYGFMVEFGTDPEMPKTWETGEAWFKTRVLRDGGSYIELYGTIRPIYHLNE